MTSTIRNLHTGQCWSNVLEIKTAIPFIVPRSEEVFDFEPPTLAYFIGACQYGRGGAVNFVPPFLGGEGSETAAAVWNFFSLWSLFLAKKIVILSTGFIKFELLLK